MVVLKPGRRKETMLLVSYFYILRCKYFYTLTSAAQLWYILWTRTFNDTQCLLVSPPSLYCAVLCLVVQLSPTLCDPMDCSPPGSSVHEISQASILEWVASPFSSGSSWPRNQTRVSCIAGGFFIIWATKEAPLCTTQLQPESLRPVNVTCDISWRSDVMSY